MHESSQTPWDILASERPDFAEVISAYFEKILSMSGLDEKTRQLVYIGVQTAVNYTPAVKAHIPFAVKAGATKDEIVGAAAIAVLGAGPKGFVSSFPAIQQAIEESLNR